MDIAIHDEVPGAARAAVLHLHVQAPTITVAALIRARVELEVERLLDGQALTSPAQLSRCLVLPDQADQLLNGPRGSYKPGARPRRDGMDVERMVAVALDAFQRRGFFLLVGDRQMEALEEELHLRATTDVVFLRLVPLQGG